uniref:SEC23 interacting protein n=1 Tax=Sphaeramia orbicularis TaxID=375764 RepID=A0A673ASR8_9TELE
MADRKNNNVPNTSSNLLFSAAPEFNFSLPFMPVSQATGPALLSGEDSNDVGEEDSFLGQTSGNGPAASTFNYFSSPVTSSDPFASIGQSPCPPPALSAAPPSMGPVSVPSSVSMAPPPSAHMQAPAFGGAVYQSPMGRQTPPPNTMTPPPPQMQPQSHNRIDTPPPAAEPVRTYRLRKSCRRTIHLHRFRTRTARHRRRSRCQDQHSQSLLLHRCRRLLLLLLHLQPPAPSSPPVP